MRVALVLAVTAVMLPCGGCRSDDRTASPGATATTTAATAAPSASVSSAPASTATPSPTPATSSATAATRSAVSVRALLTTADLAAAGFAAARDQGSRGAGDLQYAMTPCMRSQVADVTGGPAASADWYSGDATVAETVSSAAGPARAHAAAEKIAGWHRSCPGTRQISVRVGTEGRRWTFETTGDGTPARTTVLQQGDRVMVLAVTPTVSTRPAAIEQAAAARLMD